MCVLPSLVLFLSSLSPLFRLGCLVLIVLVEQHVQIRQDHHCAFMLNDAQVELHGKSRAGSRVTLLCETTWFLLGIEHEVLTNTHESTFHAN
jgi:hypothetical protein